MNEAPLLATLGANKMPAKSAPGAGGTDSAALPDDATLDAAIEFAALLLDSATALPGGKPVPLSGDILPVAPDEPVLIEVDLPLADAGIAAPIPLVSAAIDTDAEATALGADIAGQIRQAKASAHGVGPSATSDAVPAIEPAPVQQRPAVPAPIASELTLAAGNKPKADIELKMSRLGGDFSALATDAQSSSSNTAAVRGALPASLSALPTESAAARALNIDAPLGDNDWGRQFSERVGWVIHAKLPSAQLRLNPEHLGPVEMSIEVDEQQARVQFAAAHGLTRDAIEQNLPRLRELLEQQGLNLQQADVGTMAGQHGGGGTLADADTPSDEPQQAANPDVEPGDESLHQAETQHPLGLIDTFV